MLTIRDSERGVNRRDFLKIGSLGGLPLSSLLSARAFAAEQGHSLRDKSIVFLFMHGGPTQVELFDPKMTAPAEVHSATGERATTIPGVTFGGTMERLAQKAHRMTVVRSFTTGNGNHDIKPVVCSDTMNANLGSIYSRVAGTNHPVTGMPTNAALFPQAVNPNAQPANNGFGKFASTGDLGDAYKPFIPGAGGDLQKNMELALPRTRLDDRRTLLTRLDRIKRAVDSSGALEGVDRFQEQAFSTILGGVAEAFDLSKEDPRTLARYDTAPLVDPATISKRWNNHKNYRDHGQSLGKLMLLARRLCEAGCGFVTVTTNFVWDMHADQNNATLEEGMQYVGKPFDHAVAAFIEDCHERGLDDDILLVCCGEMGRTPKINAKGGRDHWGGLAPLVLSGGGLPMGQVIGNSTANAGEPQSEPVRIPNLVSTIMHTLFDVGQLRLAQEVPRDISQLITGGEPIKGLV
jgi:hypothetical protein